jgi:hypothetical protein
MRLFCWLGQLVRGRPVADCKAERRMAVRFPCRLTADRMPVHGPSGERCSVEVIDISHGGFRMVATELVEPGAFLSAQIPGEAPTTVLAYVVRVTPRPGGDWEVGCAFASEIGDDDLRRLGGESLASTAADRRGWERALCLKEISFQLLGADRPTWSPALVLDVSAGGIALHVNEIVDLQAMLRLELRGGDWQSATVLLASVVRITELTDGGWLLGCSFARELQEDEVQAILEDGTT